MTEEDCVIKLWVYGWWCNTWPEAVAKAEAIGKPVKAALDGAPIDSAVLYEPESAGGGTYD